MEFKHYGFTSWKSAKNYLYRPEVTYYWAGDSPKSKSLLGHTKISVTLFWAGPGILGLSLVGPD